MTNQAANRQTENAVIRTIHQSEMKTISRADLLPIYRHMMQQIPAINRMREILGKQPIVVPED